MGPAVALSPAEEGLVSSCSRRTPRPPPRLTALLRCPRGRGGAPPHLWVPACHGPPLDSLDCFLICKMGSNGDSPEGPWDVSRQAVCDMEWSHVGPERQTHSAHHTEEESRGSERLEGLPKVTLPR